MVIIALTHIGYNRERDVIAKIPGIDVVVGGHSHSLLSNTDPKAEGPYPTMVDNPGGYKVPVVQAASYSKYLGELKVVFDDNGNVKEASGSPIYLDKSITPDPAVLARIKELGAPIEALKNKEVSETTQPIDGSRESCRTRECEMGNLVSDAILDRVKGQGVEIVISNGGGLRASIDKGTVTMGEVLTVLPFQNTLATFQISGKDLLAGLENGLSQIEDGAGRFPQVAGIKYSFDRSGAPNAGRVKSVEVMEGGAWVPLNPDKDYLVATNNYVRQGGDGYKVFADKAKNAYDYGPGLEQVVADYLGAHRPYTPKLDGRITEIAATVAERGASNHDDGGAREAGRNRARGNDGRTRETRGDSACHDDGRARETRRGDKAGGSNTCCAGRAGKACRSRHGQPRRRRRRHLLGSRQAGLRRRCQMAADLRRQQGIPAAQATGRRDADHSAGELIQPRRHSSHGLPGQPGRLFAFGGSIIRCGQTQH